MGMGEPLANFDNVVTALRVMLDDHAYGLSRRRVTVSTSGIVPAMDRLREVCPVALAVSLRAQRCAARQAGADQSEISAQSLARRMQSLSRGCAARLHHLRVRDARWRERPGQPCARTRRHRTRGVLQVQLDTLQPVSQFRLPALVARTHPSLLDYPRRGGHRRHDPQDEGGDDVDAACGQLAGQVLDKTRRTAAGRPVIPVSEERR